MKLIKLGIHAYHLVSKPQDVAFFLSNKEFVIYKTLPPRFDLIFYPYEPHTSYKKISLILTKLKKGGDKK